MNPFSDFEHIVRHDEPLAPYTWFRLGGTAQFFAEPTSVDELAALVAEANAQGIPFRVIGDGSNVLVVSDQVVGLVVHLAAAGFCQITVEDRRVVAGGGAKLGHVISTAVREGLAGLEPLVGIPGSVGGALRGNSGASGVDMGQWTESATVMTRTGEQVVHPRDDLRFSYRQSSLDEPIILSAEFVLEKDEPRELTKRMQKAWIVKRSRLPQGCPNVGYIFKDVGGISASSMIEQAGMNTASVGEASVCAENPNFILAAQGTKASDVVQLIEQIRETVAERLGVALETAIDVW